MNTIGIDACKYGWVCACLEKKSIQIFKNLNEIFNNYSINSEVYIDMPIGLPDTEITRNCETEARKILPPKRKSSIFNVPCREAIYASSYKEANQINKTNLGKGISIQSWNIVPKIKELDQFLQEHTALRFQWKEAHPEIAFQLLKNSNEIISGKKTVKGQEERLQILQRYWRNSRAIFSAALKDYKRKEVLPDDILDALVLAVFLKENRNNKIPAETYNLDTSGLPMKIHY